MDSAAQKQKQHENGDAASDDGALLHFANRLRDEPGLVRENLYPCAFGEIVADEIGHAHTFERPPRFFPLLGLQLLLPIITPFSFVLLAFPLRPTGLGLLPALLGLCRETGHEFSLLRQPEKAVANSLGHGHHVGISLLEDLDLHALAAVHTRDHLAILVCPRHLAYVAHADYGIAALGHDEIFDLLQRAELVECAHQVLRLPFPQQPSGNVDVRQSQPGVHITDVETQKRHLRLVEGNVDLLFETSLHLDGGHTGECLELALDFLVGQLAQGE